MQIGTEPIIKIENGEETYIRDIPVFQCYGYIYGIYNTINNQIVYIGQSQFNGKNWLNRQRNYFGSGKIVKRFIKKHSKDALIKFIIDTADTPDELDILEKKYIKEYNTKVPNGWNISNGGHGYHKTGGNHKGWHHTEETKRRISEASKKMWENPEIAERIKISAKIPNNGQFKPGNIPWTKGKTKETHPILSNSGRKKKNLQSI